MSCAISLVPEILRPVVPKVTITNIDAAYAACMRLWYEAMERVYWYGSNKDKDIANLIQVNIEKGNFELYYKEALEMINSHE